MRILHFNLVTSWWPPGVQSGTTFELSVPLKGIQQKQSFPNPNYWQNNTSAQCAILFFFISRSKGDVDLLDLSNRTTVHPWSQGCIVGNPSHIHQYCCCCYSCVWGSRWNHICSYWNLSICQIKFCHNSSSISWSDTWAVALFTAQELTESSFKRLFRKILLTKQ